MKLYQKIEALAAPIPQLSRNYFTPHIPHFSFNLISHLDTGVSRLVQSVFNHNTSTNQSDSLIINGFLSVEDWKEIADSIDDAQREGFYPNLRVCRRSDYHKVANYTLVSYELGTISGYAIRPTFVGDVSCLFPILVRWGDAEIAKHQQPNAYATKELCLYGAQEIQSRPANSIPMGNSE